jgi:hypothetical protein
MKFKIILNNNIVHILDRTEFETSNEAFDYVCKNMMDLIWPDEYIIRKNADLYRIGVNDHLGEFCLIVEILPI